MEYRFFKFPILSSQGLAIRGQLELLETRALWRRRYWEDSSDNDSDELLLGPQDQPPKLSSPFKPSGSAGFLDYEQVERWLSTCETESHIQCIAPKYWQQGPSKLIDCETLRLVEADPSYPYFALSYVWGQQHHKKSSSYHNESRGLADLPATIRDAVEVTRKLGYRYLWVDRYCIDQNDPAEKHRQIKEMGQIYHNASLTIIAAAGFDPDHGLLGVSKKRKGSLHIKTTSYEGFKELIQKIRGSVWMARAWTYQEALLSRRRLIFTNTNAYFDCQKLGRADSYDGDSSGDDLDSVTYETITSKSMFHREEFGSRPDDVFDHISEYSRRKLTYEQDYLDGFLGILGYLAQAHQTVHHIFGVPILPPVKVDLIKRTISYDNISYDCQFMNGMNWKVETGRRRRAEEFPSWSWVGWSGSVTWANKDISKQMLSNPKVWVENNAGEVLSLQSFYEPLGPSHLEDYRLFKVIHIEAEVFEVKVVFLREKLYGMYAFYSPELYIEQQIVGIGHWVTWDAQGDRSVYAKLYPFEDLGEDPSRNIISQTQNFKILILATYHSADTQGKLLREIKDGYEVVGHVSLKRYYGLFLRDIPERLERIVLIPHMVRERVRLL